MASTVTVTCPECEKQIKAPADIVGKKIRCKSCAHIFVAKADAGPSKPAPAGKGGKAPPGKTAPNKGGITKAPPPAKPAKPKDDDEDENANPYGVTTLDLTPRCPNCANELESEKAVVCLTCGYNTLTREQVRTRKVHDPTGGERFMWLLPGILSALGVLLLIGNMIASLIIWNNYTPDGEDAKILTQLTGCVTLWWIMGSLWAGYKATRFAIKRLILHPTPPEIEE